MNSAEFLKEVLESDICPENFESDYSEFQHYQQLAIDTLNEFHRVCEANGINYQLAYGSLLGAIRDNGQIPWDYDIDVIVPYENKEALLSALKKDLSDKFYFDCPEVNAKCPHYLLRVTPVGYSTAALHVDVFWMVGVPSDQAERDAHTANLRKVSRARIIKSLKIIQTRFNVIKRFFRAILGRIQYMFTPFRKLDQRYFDLCAKYKFSDSEYCFPVASKSMFTYKTELFKETTTITTSIGTFYIPTRYEELLAEIYGDYKKIYPLQSRLNEMSSHLKALRHYDNTK